MDRLTIINDALIATGNAPLAVEYDGSDEWTVADSAYRRAVGDILASHPWNFATTAATLTSPASSTLSPRRPLGYAYPTDCLHIVAIQDAVGCPCTDFEIIDRTICVRSTAAVVIRYVRIPPLGQWPPYFLEAVTIQVEAHILRGLNEDTSNARSREGDAAAKVALARNRSDQQQPPQRLFRSRLTRARRGRWGGCCDLGAGGQGGDTGSAAYDLLVDGGVVGPGITPPAPVNPPGAPTVVVDGGLRG